MKQVKNDPMPDEIQKGPSTGPMDWAFIALVVLLIMGLLCSSCAPDLQIKQARAKHKADHKKEKPANNYLPLIGIACLSAWIIDRMDGN